MSDPRASGHRPRRRLPATTLRGYWPSADRALVGRTFPIDEQLELALRGSVRSEVSDLSEAENVNDRGHGRLLEVYVPLRTRHDKIPVGVFETYLSYSPIQRSIDAQTRHLYL